VVGPKDDLENHIRESYKLVREYEDILRFSGDPKERARARRGIDDQRELIKGYLAEYLPLCQHLSLAPPEDIAEIAATVGVRLPPLQEEPLRKAEIERRVGPRQGQKSLGARLLNKTCKILRDPLWQGIGALVAIVAVIVALRPHIFPPSTVRPVSTAAPSRTVSPTPYLAAAPTNTPSPTNTPTPTPIPTPTLSPLPDEIQHLLDREASIVVNATPDWVALDSIFWSDAKVIDRAAEREWTYRDFYRTQRFTGSFRFPEVRHENLVLFDSQPDQLTLGNDSCGKFQASGAAEELWGNIQGDRWVFQSRDGAWKVIEMDINNSPPADVLYTFEDGSLGCWNLSWEAGQFLGMNLANTTANAHEGAHSLSFQIDLSQPGEHRARIEHRTSQPLKGISEMSAWVLYAPEGAVAPLEAEFFVQDTSNNWHVSPIVGLTPGEWTQLQATRFYRPLDDVESQMLGLEIKLPSAAQYEHVRGVVYVDHLTIRTNHIP
jgi:hypothetical protein